jgi:hypothetical protein
MFKELSNTELDDLWNSSQHLALYVQEAAIRRDPIAFYSYVDSLKTNETILRKHFAAIAVRESK